MLTLHKDMNIYDFNIYTHQFCFCISISIYVWMCLVPIGAYAISTASLPLRQLLFASQSSIWRLLGWCVCVCWHTSSLHLCQSTIYTHRSGTLIRILNVRQVHTYTHVPLSIRGSYDAITQWPWQADRISTKRRAIRHDFHLTLDMVFFLYFPASIGGGHHHFSSGISLPSPCVPWSLLQLTFYQHSPAAHKLLQIRTQFKL